ncbi:hypothetical protein KAU11_11675 [Candidatus Babeliales bacterium]|nr:hypothetical protein [Candidatus Babeliales bacterium]
MTEYRLGADFGMDQAVRRFNSLLIAGNSRRLVRCSLVKTAAKIYSRLHVNDRGSIAVFYLLFHTVARAAVPNFMGIMAQAQHRQQLFIRAKLTFRSQNVRSSEIVYIALMISDMVSKMKEDYGINAQIQWSISGITIKQQLFEMGRYSQIIHAGPDQQFLDEQWLNSTDVFQRKHYMRLYAWLDERGMRLTSPNTRLNCFAAAIVCAVRGICFEEATTAQKRSIKSMSSKIMSDAFGRNMYELQELIDTFTVNPPYAHTRIVVMDTGLNVLGVIGNGDEKEILIAGGHALAVVPGRHVIEEEKFTLITPYVHRTVPFYYLTEIGYWDMETTTTMKPYMISIKLGINPIKVFTGLDCVTKFSQYLFNVEGHERIIIYAHNGGKFDVPIILSYFRKSPFWVITRFLEHGSRILSMTMMALAAGHSRTVTFRDSYPLMSSSLDNLSKLYGVQHPKLAGVNHELMTDEDWESQIIPQNIETYIKHDVLALKECMDKFRWTTIEQVGWDPVKRNVLTSPGISNMVFLEDFYNTDFPLFHLPASVDEFCRKAYNGGRCEVFQRKHVEQEVFYYDVVSLYPYIMSSCDLPYGKPTWIDMEDGLLPPDFFGFLQIRVIGGESQFNMIRVKSHSRGLIAPKFIQESVITIFSEELRFIIEHNDIMKYNIACIGGYHFQRSKYLRDVTNLFFEFKRKAKEEGNKVAYAAAKVRLNSIYGKFGIKRFENSIQIVRDSEKYNTMLQHGNILMSDRDFVLARTFQKVKLRHVPTAAAITAYGHMEIMSWILHCSEHGEVYYCDTDSVITSVPPEVINMKRAIGSSLGDMSMEEEEQITSLVTLSAKLYSYRTPSGDHLTSKGLPTGPYLSKEVRDNELFCDGYRRHGATEYLNHDDFVALLNGQKITMSSRRFVGGKRRILELDGGLDVIDHTMTIEGGYVKGNILENGEIVQLQGWITDEEEFFT